MKTPTSNEKLVNVRVSVELWKRARVRAIREDMTLTDVFRELLENYVRHGLPDVKSRRSS